MTPSGSPILIPMALFREVDESLIRLLRKLTPADWERSTVCSEWCVKDLAAHLLDCNLSRLSAHRDRYSPQSSSVESDTEEPLAELLRKENQLWTKALSGLSPEVLIDLHGFTGPQLIDFFRTLDPYGPARWSVSWAGESASKNWLDIARVYTEKWHHQQQIALAVNLKSEIMTRRLYHPVLDTFMRALPQTFKNCEAVEGTAVEVEIQGDAGGSWTLVKGQESWMIEETAPSVISARAIIPEDIAWRVFTKKWPREKILTTFPSLQFEGEVALSQRVVEMVSIIA